MEQPVDESSTGAAVGAVVGDVKKKIKILVAVDDSEGSKYALSWAIDHIFASADGELLLIYVQQPFVYYMHTIGLAPAAFPATSVTDSVKKAQEENAAHVMAQALAVCKERAVAAKTISIIGEGDPKEIICQIADQELADLLVIGSRGLGMIKRAFLGSVSDYCVHHANCPVLIVKPPKERK